MKNVKNRIILTFLIFLTLVFLAPTVKAQEWTFIESSGNWVMCERQAWVIPSGYGIAKWRTTISNFTGYKADFCLQALSVSRDWWEPHAEYAVFFWVNFTGSTGTNILVKIMFKHYQSFWGLDENRMLKANALVNATTSDTFLSYMTWHKYALNNIFSLYVNFNSGNFEIKFVYYDPRYDSPTVWTPKDFTSITLPSNWGENVTVDFWVERDGKGQASGFMNDEFLATTAPSGEERSESALDWIFNLITNRVPSWILGFVNTLWNWFNQLSNMLTVVFGVIAGFLPFFPFIFLLWIMDAIVTSAYYGELHPIGNVLTTIYSIGRAIIQTLANIGHAIWDMITFWS